MEIIGLLFLLSTTASAFDLIAYRGHNCVVGTAKFVCFRVGYNFCCKRRMQNYPQLFVGFLSMAQTHPQSGDVQVVHRRQGDLGCGGAVIGSDSFGCADATSGIAMVGAAHHCFGTCNKISLPACEGSVEADAVYYKNLAYESRPSDPRLGALVDKMMMDEVLTDNELQELEAVRMPSADIVETTTSQ